MAHTVPSSDARIPQTRRNLNALIGTQQHSGHTTAVTARTSDIDALSMTMPEVRRAPADGSFCVRPQAQSRGCAPQQLPEAVDYLSSTLNEAASARAAASLPVSTEDPKDNIGMLVEKVNHTLSPAPVPLLAQPGKHQAADALAATVSKDNYMQALMVVQDLRERNLSLREENAGLVVDLLTKDQVGRHSCHQDPLSKTVGSIAGGGGQRQSASHHPPVANNLQWVQAQQPQFELVQPVPPSRSRQAASPVRSMASPVHTAAQRIASPVHTAARRAASAIIPASGSLTGPGMAAAVSYPGGWQRQLPATAASLSNHVQSLDARAH